MDLIVDGLHIKGVDSGRGPVALLLHGWNSDHKTMTGLKPALAGYRIVAPDLPGFGGSQLPLAAWSIEDYAGFVEGSLAKLKIKQPDIVIGHSFGGRIALELTGSGRLNPKKLVLLASHGLPEERRDIKSRLVGFASNIGKVLPPAWRSAVGRRWRSEDYKNLTGVMAETFLKIISQDATAVCQNIGCPTLLVYGQDDTTTPPELGRRFNDLIAGSRLELVEGAGHYVHLDQPERVEQLIKDFIK